MNIWIFNHYSVGENSIGITRHYDLAKNLVKRGHSVKIFASSFNHQTRTEKINYDKNTYFIENQNGVEFCWIKTHPYNKNDKNRIINILSFYKRVKKAANKQNDIPDIVIGSLFHPLAVIVANKVAKKHNALFYFEERDFWPQTLIDFGKVSETHPIARYLYRLESNFYRDAHRIILLFDQAHKYVESRGVSQEKIVYLPNGVDLTRNDTTEMLPLEIEEFFENNKHKTISIYTGTHGLANNLDAIIDAAKEIDQDKFAFLFVGDGPEKERLIDKVETNNIKNVYFADPVQKQVIPAILRRAHIGLLPLKDSPVFKFGISPNKLYDYMVNKLPVILLCNLDNTVVETNDAGIVIKKDFKNELVNTYNNLNIENLNKQGQNAYNYVIENHNWENLSEHLEKVMLNDLQNFKG